ncbi:hypothetical protein ACFL5D_02195 [Candidatus Neomarinimicrobiota bacterium]
MKFSNRTKGVYLIWFSVIFILYLVAGNYGLEYTEELYPFSFGPFVLDGYDLSEFLIYSIVPPLLIVAYELITAKKD